MIISRLCSSLAVIVLFACAALPAMAQRNVPVPSSCTPQVNQKLADLLNEGIHRYVDNVMICGITFRASHHQYGHRHGDHEILPLRATMPDGSTRLIEVVVNDDLDGAITAPANATVFAYGQAFFPTRGHFVAGIHDVHCATHRGADNGWVVVNSVQHPANCSP